jgi:hypothetical protein
MHCVPQIGSCLALTALTPILTLCSAVGNAHLLRHRLSLVPSHRRPGLSEESDQPEKLMVSPRSGSYERLESGMGPSRLGVRNFTWRKIAFCLALVVTFVWFLSPTEPKKVWGGLKTPGESWSEG